jgi:hypothetical protein
MSRIPEGAVHSLLPKGCTMIFSIPLYDALLGVNVTPEKAKAVVDAFEQEQTAMSSTLATKTDLQVGLASVESKIAAVEAKIVLLESRMTVRLGAMMCALAGLVFAAIKLF